MSGGGRLRCVALSLGILGAASGCKYLRAPAEPTVLGLESFAVLPEVGDDLLPLTFKLRVRNPNELPLTVVLKDELRITEAASGRVLALARAIGPVSIPATGEQSAEVEVGLAFSRESWARDVVLQLSRGAARVRGTALVRYGGDEFLVDIDARPEAKDLVLPWPVRLAAVERVTLTLVSMNRLEVEVRATLDNPSGLSLRLEDARIELAAPETLRPLLAALAPVDLMAGDGQAIQLRGHFDLDTCDPDLLDQLERAREHARLAVSGLVRGPRVPPTDLSGLLLSLPLAPTDKSSVAAVVDLQVGPIAATQLVLRSRPPAPSRIAALGAALMLGGVAELSVTLVNPLPGTVRHKRAALRVVAAEAVAVEARLAEPTELKPRSEGTVPLVITAPRGGPATGLEILAGLLFRQELPEVGRGLTEVDWEIEVPVFGAITVVEGGVQHD
jgi:hypothetical protein